MLPVHRGDGVVGAFQTFGSVAASHLKEQEETLLISPVRFSLLKLKFFHKSRIPYFLFDYQSFSEQFFMSVCMYTTVLGTTAFTAR